jgi:hypothetical protein
MSGNQQPINTAITEESSIDLLTGSTEFEPLVGIRLPETASLSSQDSILKTLSVNDFTGAVGSNITIPISIDNASGLQSLTLTLTYDNNILSLNDPNPETPTNEAVRRTGISSSWQLIDETNPDTELPNPTANDNNGELTISLINPNNTPASGSGELIAIDFQVNVDAATDAQTAIDLTAARLGINGAEIVLNQSNLTDGSLTVTAANNIDIDGNGSADALTDGVLIVRHLFGFSGDSLISGAVGANATRSGSEAIQAYISQIESSLDIDGNGVADALTDGVLIVRHLFGFSGNTLIADAIAGDATRTSAVEIADTISDLLP